MKNYEKPIVEVISFSVNQDLATGGSGEITTSNPDFEPGVDEW